MIGVNIGTQIKTIDVQSRTNPSKKVTARKNRMTPVVPPPKPLAIADTISPPPLTAKMPVNIVPPATISRIIAVMRTVSDRESTNEGMVIPPLMTARITAPATPTAAASVGDAIPPNSDPSTANINSKGGTKALSVMLILMLRGLSSLTAVAAGPS